MHRSGELRPLYPGEELANAMTHGLGAALSVAALALLVTRAALHGDVWSIVGCSVFGATLLLLYTASTLYHGLANSRAEPVLQAVDHSAIYLLIAGTYTPLTLVSLRGPWGWSLFGVVWAAAVVGITVRWLGKGRHHGIAVAVYVAMGWVAVVAVRPLFESVAPAGLLMILLGGLCYTGGVGFYLWRRLPYHHAIWHLFVLLGSSFHVLGVLYWVIPPPAA